jgi:hypothetical protein
MMRNAGSGNGKTAPKTRGKQDTESEDTNDQTEPSSSLTDVLKKLKVYRWKCVGGFNCVSKDCENKYNWTYKEREPAADGRNMLCGECGCKAEAISTDNARCLYEWNTITMEGEDMGIVVVGPDEHNHDLRPEAQCSNEKTLRAVKKIALGVKVNGRSAGIETINQGVQLTVDQQLSKGSFPCR